MCLSTHYNQQALGYLHANLIFAKWLRFTLRRSLLSCIFHLLLIQLSLLSFSQVAVHGQSPDASQHAFHPTGAMPTVTLLFPLCDSWATPALGHSSCERAAERHRPGSGPCPSHISQHHLFPALEKPLPPAVMRWPCHKVCMHATVKAIVPRYGNHVKHWQII